MTIKASVTDLTKTPFVMHENEFNAFFKLAEQKPWLKDRERDESVRHLLELCQYHEEVELLLEMIDRFELVNSSNIISFVNATLEKIYAIPDFSHKNIAFVPKQKHDGTDSSLSILQNVQSSFDPKSKLTKIGNVYLKAKKALENNSIERIVLIDDFSGTGESLYKYVDWMDRYCDELNRDRVKVYAYFYYAMEDTSQRHYPSSLEVCDISNVLKKGISGYNFNADLTSKIASMKRLESHIKKLKPEYSLGYKQSETLYACDGLSTPNNVFPIFWKREIVGKDFFRPLLIRG